MPRIPAMEGRDPAIINQGEEGVEWSEFEDEDDAGIIRRHHPQLNGKPCDENGVFIPKDKPPPPREARAPDDYTPFKDRNQFETTGFCYTRAKLSAKNVNLLSILWAASLAKHKDSPPI
ncbi:hypothetical protein CERSUDRAFT_101537, partial [Gelatoporia subvermispora B]